MYNIKRMIGNDYKEMSLIASEVILGMMYQNRRVNLAITGGTTPKMMYEYLVPRVRDKAHFNNVHFYNFDELPHKSESKEGIIISELKKYFLTPAKIPKENIHQLDEKSYLYHDKQIFDDGGLDAIIMGIGADGHFCANLPRLTKFSDYTVKVACSNELKKRMSSLYESIDDIPDFFITMGPRSVMSAKRLIVIASGKDKAPIVEQLLTKNITPDIPASILTMHPDLTLIIDREAASLLNQPKLS